MTAPVRFLTSLAQAFAAMGLYKDGHPARARALDAVFQHVQELQELDPLPEFTFLAGEVLYGNEPLWDLKGWDWADRLAAVGVQRLALTGPVSLGDVELFLEDVMGRVSGEPKPSAEARPTRETSIRYGLVKIKGDEEESEETEVEELATATLGFTLREEAEAVEWIHDELRNRGDLHLIEAEAVVRSLAVAMHGDHQFLIPLLQLKEFDQYTTTHALNVSILAMALAEFIGLGAGEVRTFGISGLLHDVGKTRIPPEILNKPGKLTDEEREVMNGHPVDGARIIIETDHQLDLAAVVAYEHHIRIDGGGYPPLAYPRSCHQCSNLVHVCDVFDALRTDRPYRDAWEHQRVIDYVREGLGKEFESELGRQFLTMMEHWETRITTIRSEDEPLPIAAAGAEGAEQGAEGAEQGGEPTSGPGGGTGESEGPAS